MAQIFGSATQTIIWLDDLKLSDVPTPAKSDAGKIRLKDLNGELEACLSMIQPDKLKANASLLYEPQYRLSSRIYQYVSVLYVLQWICEHPYWKRVWIVQEIKLGGSKSLIFGHFIMNWATLTQLLEHVLAGRPLLSNPQAWVAIFPFFGRSIFEIRHARNEQQIRTSGVNPWFVPKPTKSIRLLSKITKCLRRADPLPYVQMNVLWITYRGSTIRTLTCPPPAEDEQSRCPEAELYELLQYYHVSKCQDRHDKLYAFIGLSPAAYGLPVDYGINVYDLYFSCFDHFVDAIGSSGFKATASDIAYQLRFSFTLGPLDFILGDPRGRSMTVNLIRKGAPDQCDDKDGTSLSAVASTKERGYWHVFGHCRLCKNLIEFQDVEALVTSTAIVQCTALGRPKPSGTDNKVRSTHILQYHSKTRLTQRASASAAVPTNDKNTPGLMTSSYPLARLALSDLIAVLRLHGLETGWRQAMDTWNMPDTDPDEPEIEPDSYLRRVLEAAPPTPTDTSCASISRKALDALDLEDSTRRKLVEWLGQEGFAFEEGVVT